MATCSWRFKPIQVIGFFAFAMAAAALFMVVGVSLATWRQNQIQNMIQQWPTTQATIEGGRFDRVPGGSGSQPLKAPILYFSYHVGGEYLRGRVALMEFFDDSGEEIIRRMILKKLEIHYDPQDATRWFFDDDRIAGCRIRQEGLQHETSRSF
jgi:hypothetical protein